MVDTTPQEVNGLVGLRARHLNLPTVLFAVLSLLFYLPSLLMPHIWYDLHSWEVGQDGGRAADVRFDIDRTVHRSFPGSFTSTVRTLEGAYTCTNHSGVFEYRTNVPLLDGALTASERAMPMRGDRVGLAYWLGGEDALKRCEAAGMHSGTFVVETCHTVHVGQSGLPLARNCNEGPPFTIEEMIP